MNPHTSPPSPFRTAETFARLAGSSVAAAAGPLHNAEQAAARIRIDLDLLGTRLRVLTEGLSSTSAAADLFRRAAVEAQRERMALETELERLASTVQRQEQDLKAGLRQVQATAVTGAETAARASLMVPSLETLHFRQTALADETAEVADRASASVERWRAMLRREV